MNKQETAISNLPENPNKHIYSVVYNSDMVKFTNDLIKKIKGRSYMEHITVVAKGDPTKERDDGYLYFDPTLMDLIGNGGHG